MNNLIFTINAVMPLFIIALSGMLLRRVLRADGGKARILNQVCYYLLLPCSLFQSAYRCDFTGIGDVWLYVLGAASFVVSVPPIIWLAARMTPDRRMAGAFANSAFRPNCALLGIPLAISVLGEKNAFPAVLMTMVLMPLFNVLGVFTLTYFSQGEKRINPLHIIKSIVTNPLILSILLGFLCAALDVELPELVALPISKLASAASPLAMLSIGFGFEIVRLNGDKKLILTAAAIKIILLPLVFTLVAIALGFRGNDLFAIYLIHAVPTAANASVIADSMGCDGTLAGEIVLTTTLASAFTLVGGILLLQSFGLL